jgi:hypothetical protein
MLLEETTEMRGTRFAGRWFRRGPGADRRESATLLPGVGT